MAKRTGRAKRKAVDKPRAPALAPAPLPAFELWPAHQIERWPLARILPNPRNARLHSEDQLRKIERSFRAFGQTRPVLVDEAGVLIAGHGTRAGAQRAGCTELMVVVARGWSEAQKSAYMLADNRIAEEATWDASLLAAEMAWLQGAGFDPTLTAFDDKEIERLLWEASGRAGGREGSDPDAEIAPPAAPVSKRGDVWQLGRHRLVCGDSTAPADVDRVLDGAEPHLMVTDPPYGVEYKPAWRNEALRDNGSPLGARAVGRVANDGRAVGRVANDGRADWREAWALFQGDVCYVWHGAAHAAIVAESLESVKFGIRAQIIWAKNNIVIGRGDYHWKHEPCWYAVREGAIGHWQGARDQNTLWQIDKPMKSETGHGTQKPVECMKRPIENNSEVGDAVYEPFSGSGTTIIAAEMTGRVCHAIEIDPAYVDVAVRRWEVFTGERAKLVETGTVEATREPREAAAAA